MEDQKGQHGLELLIIISSSNFFFSRNSMLLRLFKTCRYSVCMYSTLNTLLFHIYKAFVISNLLIKIHRYVNRLARSMKTLSNVNHSFSGWGSWRLSIHIVYISFLTPLIQLVYKGSLFWFIYRCITYMDKMIFWWMNLGIIYFIYSNSYIQTPTIMHITLPV